MHDLLDTEDADAASERYWPEDFKGTIRVHVARTFSEGLQKAQAFRTTYETHYAERFDTYEQFVERLAEMTVIGAENGADMAFDEIHTAFRSDAPMPIARPFARIFRPEPFDEAAKDAVREKIIEDYRDIHAYQHVYEDHHQEAESFDAFVSEVAELVVLGAVNGADDMIGKLYRAFLTASPLPPARRRPKRLR